MVILSEEEQAEVERTEHLMNVVVEMRKRHGAACADYTQRAAAVEQQLLQLSLDAVSRATFKPHATPLPVAADTMDELKEFDAQLDGFGRRVEELRRRMKHTAGAVQTMRRADPALAGSRRQLRADVLLARARNKNRE